MRSLLACSKSESSRGFIVFAQAIALILIAVPLTGASGCARHGSQVVAIDLMKLLGQADLRPPNTFTISEHSCAEGRRPGVQIPPVSRGTWTLSFPERATLAAFAAVQGTEAASAEFRVGMSDDRVYETLHTQVVSAADCARGWTELRVDLSRYAGRQFSLFYRPDRKKWKLILGVNTRAGAPDAAFWGAPRIEADVESVKRYLAQRR